ncbi:MAG: EAL domain-containing protein [Bradyrhizobiaceae bacterium]|nr:MAG: EAL domain-containing protein [Bradyrhizobiaceae bacterium]
MIRISTIFIAICMVLIAASLGLVLYSLAGLGAYESALVALTALTFLILYNAVSMRLRDRTDVGGQIADLSRGTADLARQIAEFGRRLSTVEARIASSESAGQERMHAVMGEIGELGQLVTQLADSVALHDDLLATAGSSAASLTTAASPAPARPATQSDSDVVAPFPAAATVSTAPETAAAPSPKSGPAETDIIAAIKSSIEANRIDLYLQPMVTLPQRKVRFYEAVSRLRDEGDSILTASDFIGPAESSGLIGQIDYMVMFRCVQVLRRLQVRSKDVGVFCNVSSATLGNQDVFAQCVDFLEANRALAPSLVFEFKHSTYRNLGPKESENLATLHRLGYSFSVDNVSDLRIDGRQLADRGVRYIKIPASLLLDQKQLSSADIHAADLSSLLGRFGIDLIAEKIEGERAVVDLLDYDVRFGQGFLFSAPRPLRPESAPADTPKAATPAAVTANPVATESQRLTGNAALVRRTAQS